MSRLTLSPLAEPVQAEITVPGSKSYTIRALLLAAMTEGPVRIDNPLRSDDTQAMLSALQTLGIETRVRESENAIEVLGSVRDVAPATYALDAHLSAASLRFLLALSCVIPGEQILYGHEGLNRRPVKDLVESLRAMGAEIEYMNREGYPPVRVLSSGLRAGRVTVPGQVSSQYLSALIMIAPFVNTAGADALTLDVAGELISKPYLDMTLDSMQAFGVSVENRDYQQFSIPIGQVYHANQYTVEADASSAAYFLAMAALSRSTVTLKNINPRSRQADMRFVSILSEMGNAVQLESDRLILNGRGVKPLTIDMRDCPDQAQTLAVLAAFADGTTRITGLQSLRVKETDRLRALEQELTKMGIAVSAGADSLEIHGGQPNAATIETYGDHRMAMSFAVAGSVLPELRINHPEVVRKTYPHFWEDVQRLGLRVRRTRPARIVLIGFMGAGKSLLAPLLAEALEMQAVDMDALIVERSDRTDISDIFARDGEVRFRELEQAVAKDLQAQANCVVATGGGVVMNKLTMEYLKRDSLVIYLAAELETIAARVGSSEGKAAQRPLLGDAEQMAALFNLRAPLYEHYADVKINTDACAAQEVQAQILRQLESLAEAAV